MTDVPRYVPNPLLCETLSPAALIAILGSRFVCTRQKGHDGDHQAHAAPDLRLVAEWPREDPT